MPYDARLVREPVRFETSGPAVSYRILAWLGGIASSLAFAYAAF